MPLRRSGGGNGGCNRDLNATRRINLLDGWTTAAEATKVPKNMDGTAEVAEAAPVPLGVTSTLSTEGKAERWGWRHMTFVGAI